MQQTPDLVWIFSSGRSGTTWLMRLLSGSLRIPQWNEPLIGRMVAGFVAREGWRPSSGHLLSEADRHVFVAGVRAFMQGAAAARFPGEPMIVVKEPNGSSGAPLLTEALPDSRVVTLVRDMRDVVASSLDGKRPGGWQNPEGDKPGLDIDTLELTEDLTRNAMRNMRGAIEAYDAHPGPKSLVRYEDLLADTPATVSRILTELDIPFKPRRVVAVAAKKAFSEVNPEKRGSGKFFRSASPGSWSEDLTPEQVEIVEKAAAPVLDRFY